MKDECGVAGRCSSSSDDAIHEIYDDPSREAWQATFLKEYWKRKPVVLRGFFEDSHPALTGDDVAGLACEGGVDSKVVVENGRIPWSVMHGPFAERDFSSLTGTPGLKWCLLVYGVDRWIPGVSELFDRFPFIPRWKFDDIMVSYSPMGGMGVGPHVDSYDVFLLQTSGSKVWTLSREPLANQIGKEIYVEGLETKILRDNAWDRDYITRVKPGDVLYIPPGVAHHGVSVVDKPSSGGESITISVGIRDPSTLDIIGGLSDHLVSMQSSSKECVTSIPLPEERACAGELTPETVRGIVGIAASQLFANGKSIADTEILSPEVVEWVGKLLTRSRGEPQQLPFRETYDDVEKNFALTNFILDHIKGGGVLRQNESTRVAYYVHPEGSVVSVFANGVQYRTEIPQSNETSRSILQAISSNTIVPRSSLVSLLGERSDSGIVILVEQLVRDGVLYIE